MLKKRGFTIVELIAVFLVLGIVLAISIPTVTSIVGASYQRAYELNLGVLSQTAKDYIISEQIRIDVGSQLILPIDDMSELDHIKDPKDRADCEGYVLITSTDKGYEYHPYLKCGSNYVSPDYGNFDTIPPVITLVGDSFVNLFKGAVYVDLGAVAEDETDGDITGNIIKTGAVNPNKLGTYIITYRVSDNAGNEAEPVIRTINVVDASAPVITILGSNPTNINIGSDYSELGAIASDDVDGNITSDIQIISTVNPNILGSYTVTYTVVDSSGNEGIAVRVVNIVDEILPTVSFGTNGNSTYAKSRSTTVNVTDLESGINPDSLMRIWNTSTTKPLETDFSTYFTDGETLTTPSGVTGSYYLWVLAKDNVGNTTIKRSNAFNLDNTKPVITRTGDSSITITQGMVYTDGGAVAVDNIDATVTVVTTGTVDINIPGTYTITYNATDVAGNIAVPVTRSVTVIAAQITLAYTGTTETYTVLATGTYELEVWGAQGAASGGLGGYVLARVPLNKDDVLTINVGGTDGYNGGGGGAATGGGATTILKNGVALVVGAGGGAGSGGTAGGTGTSAGGTSVGGCSGSAGTGGGGGGSSCDYTYYDSCKTGDPYSCVGGDKTCTTSACGCNSCVNSTCSAKTCTDSDCGCKSCVNSSCSAKTCTDSACGCLSCVNSSCSAKTCTDSDCGCLSCVNSSCSAKTCTSSSCGCKSCTRTSCSSCGYKSCANCTACGSYYIYCCPDGDCRTSSFYCSGGGSSTRSTRCKSCVNSSCDCLSCTVTSCTYCGAKTCTSGSICGYNSCANCTACGAKTCTSGTICGYNSCANCSACGAKTCTSGSICGYNSCASCTNCGAKTCTSGPICGYNSCANCTACGAKTCQDPACGWDSCLTTENTCAGGYTTNDGRAGNGGTNIIGTGVTSISNQSGIRANNGAASISFVVE